MSACKKVVWFYYVSMVCSSLLAATVAKPVITEAVDIGTVWPGHPVGFCLVTHGKHQFAAYYDAARRMTVASRVLGATNWTYSRLPSTLGWDSHNSVTMAIDADDRLHISGNMHCNPLVYFRSEKRLDVTSLKAVQRMTGKEEHTVTYPKFLHDARDRLLFMYRDGSSGNGKRLVNIYNAEKRVWRRLIDRPLLNGREHSMNAYPSGPVKGPDGLFHLVWMWRDTGDARSNHDISYACSPDFVHWRTAGGDPVSLPITPGTTNTIVDPVAAFKGLINMGFSVSFDPGGRPVVIYHKYDRAGKSQIYRARWEKEAWSIKAMTTWTSRWDFGGGGSIPCHVAGGPLKILPDGRLAMTWRNTNYGRGTWQLDPESLEVIGNITLPARYPAELEKPMSDDTRMTVHWCESTGDSHTGEGKRYVLRWETLPRNRDKPFKGPLPEPALLRLYQITMK